jgi:hypothetical protein
MSYEATIASFGGDKTTLPKSFIISLENATTNWYARLPPRSITSWAQLKEKFPVNFQGFLVDVSTEEDFFSYQLYKRETLLDFFCRFLQLKTQAPEVSDEQAMTQAIKALCVGQLHSHLVRERLRTLEEMYDEFHKFSRAEVLHFCKLGQRRKFTSKIESSTPFKYNKGKKAEQVSTCLIDKFTASTRMGVGH